MSSSAQSQLPDHLKRQYESLDKMRSMMNTMKQNQSLRGIEKYQERMNVRSTTHNTWRQMKGMQLAMHELNHPGNKPFAIGFGITASMFLYAYFQGIKSDEAKAQSKYYQRFHAKHTDDHSHSHGGH